MKGLTDINDVTNRPLKRRRNQIPPCVKAVRKLIDEGRFDPKNLTHAHMLRVAERHGHGVGPEEESECQE